VSDAHRTTANIFQEVLASEVEACRRMVALTLQERSTLETGDVAALAAVLRDKEAALESLNKWHADRERMVRDSMGDELPDAGITLPQTPADMDEASRRELEPLQHELVDLVRQLLVLNHGNRLLIQADLDQIDATFSFLAQATEDDSGIYKGVGTGQLRPVTGNMLNWEV
jgi:hypothetical protein